MRAIKNALLACWLLFLIPTIVSCDAKGGLSRINPNRQITSATLLLFTPSGPLVMNKLGGKDSISIPPELLKQVIIGLTKGRHRYDQRKGVPSSRLAYILDIRQNGVNEKFYFLDNFEIVTFDLPEKDRITIAEQMKEITAKLLRANSK